MYDLQEKRIYIRRFTAINVTCYSADGLRPLDTCLLVNISKGGIAIESKKIFLSGEKLLTCFTSPERKKHYMLAEILHSSPGGFGKLYGAKFCENNLKNLASFNAYLLKYFNLY